MSLVLSICEKLVRVYAPTKQFGNGLLCSWARRATSCGGRAKRNTCTILDGQVWAGRVREKEGGGSVMARVNRQR